VSNSTVKHAPADTAMPMYGSICMSAQANWADLSGVDRSVTTGVVADVRTFPGTNAWSPPT
jgi:hypothetical protein